MKTVIRCLGASKAHLPAKMSAITFLGARIIRCQAARIRCLQTGRPECWQLPMAHCLREQRRLQSVPSLPQMPLLYRLHLQLPQWASCSSSNTLTRRKTGGTRTQRRWTSARLPILCQRQSLTCQGKQREMLWQLNHP